MKVLYLSSWYPSKVDPQNGVFVRKHARAAASCCDVTVVHAQPSPETFKDTSTSKQNLNEWIGYYHGPTPLHRARRYNKTIKTLLSNNGADINQYDLVHAHILTRSGYLAYRNYKKYGTPYLISEHWSGYVTGKYTELPGWKKRLNKKIVDHAAGVICVSDFLASHMKKELPHPNYRIIPNVIESSTLMARRTHTEFTFLAVGDMVDDIKNISGIVKAFKSIADDQPCRLHLVGGGKDLEKIRSLVYELGLEHKTTLYGRLSNEEVLPIYKQADAVVINSFVETFSMVGLEAVSAGIPVISTKCGGPVEVLPDETTLFVTPGDDEALADAMNKVMNDQPTYIPHHPNEVLKQYGLKAVGKHLCALYQEILSDA